MNSTTVTAAPIGAATAFDTVTTAIAELHDAARMMWAQSVMDEWEGLLVAAYELLRDGELGDRAQQVGAALAACGRRQPTLLVERGLRVDLTPGAPRTASVRHQNVITVLILMESEGLLEECEQARRDWWEWILPTCRHTWCAVAGRLRRSRPL